MFETISQCIIKHTYRGRRFLYTKPSIAKDAMNTTFLMMSLLALVYYRMFWLNVLYMLLPIMILNSTWFQKRRKCREIFYPPLIMTSWLSLFHAIATHVYGLSGFAGGMFTNIGLVLIFNEGNPPEWLIFDDRNPPAWLI